MPKIPKRLTRKDKIAATKAAERVAEIDRLKEKSEAVRTELLSKGTANER